MRDRSFTKQPSAVLLLLLAMSITSHGQTFKTLVNFDKTNGADPSVALVQGRDGNFYSTAYEEGTLGFGTVFRMTRAGKLSTIYNFCSQTNCTDGAYPGAALLLASDGNFYGTTGNGGTSVALCQQGCGTVFKITPQGKLTTLHRFDHTDGYLPAAELIQGLDGNFYGTTNEGGKYGLGTVFKITPSGTLTTLHVFGSVPFDSAYVNAGMLQMLNGTFFGTASSGGTNCSTNGTCGTVFKMTPDGTVTTVYNFCINANCTDGDTPTGTLILAKNGDFYSTTSLGGIDPTDFGTVFRMTIGGDLTTIHAFCLNVPCSDGSAPNAGLIQATDENLYGTTEAGGASKCAPLGAPCGNIFRVTSGGPMVTLHTFSGPDGAIPRAALLQGTDGNLYGSTGSGGANGDGTIFRISTGLNPFVRFVRNFGSVGQVRGILGQGFTGTTNVSFNGTSAAFTVVSDTYLTASVPTGATTGDVTVTTPAGTLTSNQPFTVLR
jgi:uncharacterized repeat protein (TIGR03803 family)